MTIESMSNDSLTLTTDPRSQLRRRLALVVIRLASCLLLGFGAVMGQTAPDAEAPPPSSVQGYLYLEPFEARVELLIAMPTALQWLKQPGDGDVVVPPESHASIRTQMGAMAADWCRVVADEVEAQGALTSVAIVKGKPGATLPMKDGESAAAKELMVGVVYDFSIPGGPSKVELRWKTFVAPVTQIPVTIFAGTQSEQMNLTQLLPQIRWMNNGRLPKPRPVAEVPAISVPDVYPIPVVSIIWIVFGLGLYIWVVEIRDKKFPGGTLPFAAAWAFGVVMTWSMTVDVTDPFAPKLPVIESPQAAEPIVSPLLKNIYRAFDYRKEQDIYDRLDHSVHGDLLRTLYLQTVQALTLEGQDGTRTRVTDLSVTIDSVKHAGNGFIAACEWTAMGTVGHWGHQHTRVNRYKANVTVNPIGSEWKLTALEVLEERRL